MYARADARAARHKNTTSQPHIHTYTRPLTAPATEAESEASPTHLQALPTQPQTGGATHLLPPEAVLFPLVLLLVVVLALAVATPLKKIPVNTPRSDLPVFGESEVVEVEEEETREFAMFNTAALASGVRRSGWATAASVCAC